MAKLRTQWKFRHTRRDAEGRRSLIWASSGPDGYFDFPVGLVPVGSAAYDEVCRSQLWTPNNLANEGKLDLLDVYFDTQAVRSNLYARLYNDTPVDADGLSDLTGEVSGTGYAALTYARGTDWATPAMDGSTGKSAGALKTYVASGSWSAATYIVLASVASGTSGLLIAYAALAATRTLADGDELEVTPSAEMD